MPKKIEVSGATILNFAEHFKVRRMRSTLMDKMIEVLSKLTPITLFDEDLYNVFEICEGVWAAELSMGKLDAIITVSSSNSVYWCLLGGGERAQVYYSECNIANFPDREFCEAYRELEPLTLL